MIIIYIYGYCQAAWMDFSAFVSPDGVN